MKINKLEQFLINEEESVLTSMKKLDINAHKILFVIDKSKSLIGSLTDGDIRRWILSGKDLSEQVLQVCNKSPLFVYEGYSNQEIRDLMLAKNIECIPILSLNKTIVDVLFWVDIFQDKNSSKTINPNRR
jgi:CBS domain-containing protein